MKGRGAPPLTSEEREELLRLRGDLEKRKSTFLIQKKVSIQAKVVDSDDSSEVC